MTACIWHISYCWIKLIIIWCTKNSTFCHQLFRQQWDSTYKKFLELGVLFLPLRSLLQVQSTVKKVCMTLEKLFQLIYFYYVGTITAFHFLGWILFQNCQKMWFRNVAQQISSPVTSCETTCSLLNTERLLPFLWATLVRLPVRPGRVPTFESVWSGHHVNRRTQTANSTF